MTILQPSTLSQQQAYFSLPPQQQTLNPLLGSAYTRGLGIPDTDGNIGEWKRMKKHFLKTYGNLRTWS
jgi:hypothetical protein